MARMAGGRGAARGWPGLCWRRRTRLEMSLAEPLFGGGGGGGGGETQRPDLSTWTSLPPPDGRLAAYAAASGRNQTQSAQVQGLPPRISTRVNIQMPTIELPQGAHAGGPPEMEVAEATWRLSPGPAGDEPRASQDEGPLLEVPGAELVIEHAAKGSGLLTDVTAHGTLTLCAHEGLAFTPDELEDKSRGGGLVITLARLQEVEESFSSAGATESSGVILRYSIVGGTGVETAEVRLPPARAGLVMEALSLLGHATIRQTAAPLELAGASRAGRAARRKARQHYDDGFFASASAILTLELLRLKNHLAKLENKPPDGLGDADPDNNPRNATILPPGSASPASKLGDGAFEDPYSVTRASKL